MLHIQNVVVPTDFSTVSYSAFEFARSLAEQYNAKIHLIYVLEKVPPYLAVRSIDSSEEKVMASMEDEANTELQNTAKKLRESTNVTIVPVLRKGQDYEEIINYTLGISADLIVIATHGRTGLSHTLLGSVAEKVIRHSKVPVLVIPAGEDQ